MTINTDSVIIIVFGGSRMAEDTDSGTAEGSRAAEDTGSGMVRVSESSRAAENAHSSS